MFSCLQSSSLHLTTLILFLAHYRRLLINVKAGHIGRNVYYVTCLHTIHTKWGPTRSTNHGHKKEYLSVQGNNSYIDHGKINTATHLENLV